MSKNRLASDVKTRVPGTLSFWIGLLLRVPFSGCPDYGHLRPEPDYQNMTDSGKEADEDANDE